MNFRFYNSDGCRSGHSYPAINECFASAHVGGHPLGGSAPWARVWNGLDELGATETCGHNFLTSFFNVSTFLRSSPGSSIGVSAMNAA